MPGNGPVSGRGRYLQFWEREEIAAGLAEKLSYRAIAGQLAPGRWASVVSREVRRNGRLVRGRYRYRALAARCGPRSGRGGLSQPS